MNDEAFTLYIAPLNTRHGKFKEGNIPWNRGKSWKEQGLSDEDIKNRIEILKAHAHIPQKGCKPTHSRPVIQMDEYGNRLHWYISSDAAAKKLGLHGRNIRKVCDGERKHTGGYRWAWDKNFLT